MNIDPTDHPNMGIYNQNTLKTTTGVYYSGMTHNQIQGDTYVSNKIRKRFEKIDKNKDGVLSNEEIIDERKKETKKAGILLGILALCTGAYWTGYVINGKKMSDLIFSGAMTGLTLTQLVKIYKEAKENKEIETKFIGQA